MLSIVLSISMSATPTTSTTTDRWRAFAAEHEAARDWCEASFYRARVLDESKLHDDVYRAFLAAYAADQLQTARTLLDTLKLDELDLTDDARKKIARIQLDLETVTPLEDATCAPHQGVCGDAIVDVGETCDDGNTDAHDGCSATCTLEPPPPIVHMTTTTEPPPARPEHVEVAHTAPMSGLVIAAASQRERAS